MLRSSSPSIQGWRRVSCRAILAAAFAAVLVPATASAQVQLTLSKAASGTFEPGSTVTYTITGTNLGVGAQLDNPGNEFTDVLPASLTLVSAAATSGTAVATIATNTVTWNGAVPASATVTVTITATIDAGTEGQIISNQGVVAYDADGNGTNESAAFTDDPGVGGPQDPTSFTVPFPPVVIAPTSLPTVPVNVMTTQTISATGGNGGPYTFTVVAGAPPSGVTLSAAGSLSGTPTATGTFNFTVSANDGVSPIATQAYAWTIAPAITVTPTALPTLVVNQPVSIPFAATGGGGGPFTFSVSSGALPAGVLLNATTGLASGTPTTAGNVAFTIRALDAASGTAGTRAYTGAVLPERTYFLAEGATGPFFDEDLLIANPTLASVQLTIDYLPDSGSPITENRTLAAQSRLTVRLDDIPALATGSSSVLVTSPSGAPLAVERTMFWDTTAYGGHTGSAVTSAAPRWFFAEGSQGYFNTFVLIANPQSTSVDVTVTFLLENAAPVTSTLSVAARSRATVVCGNIASVVNRSFGIVVDATQPVVAERAMYFGSTPQRALVGGHDSAGVTALASSWFLAEAATGSFFDTFVLLMNPGSTAANVTLRYLLPNGATIDVPKVVPAQARLTVNVETEPDPRLQANSVSVTVVSDQPIVAERSMYWGTGEGVSPWGEAHNSFGVTTPGPRWALAEGRAGGPLEFRTYILIANPGSVPTTATVTYLPETGAAITRTYAVGATSRATVDVGSDVPQLVGQRFGAAISASSNVPIIVERSMYWNGAGLFWSGGTNAVGIPLP